MPGKKAFTHDERSAIVTHGHLDVAPLLTRISPGFLDLSGQTPTVFETSTL
ncbi:hypothetical protein [Okibacterium endophyticum]